MTPSRIANKLWGECSYHTPIRVVLSTKKLGNRKKVSAEVSFRKFYIYAIDNVYTFYVDGFVFLQKTVCLQEGWLAAYDRLFTGGLVYCICPFVYRRVGLLYVTVCLQEGCFTAYDRLFTGGLVYCI
jgi:hypothetical protein